MLDIGRYIQASRLDNATIRMDQAGENLLVKSSPRNFLGRMVSWIGEMGKGSRANNQATWHDFIDTLRTHYHDDTAIQALLRDLETQSARCKPLTSMQVKTCLQNAEHQLKFKNEQILAQVLNEKVEPQADRPASLAKTASQPVAAAMDEVYHDMAARMKNHDQSLYVENSARWANAIIQRLKSLKPEAGQQHLSRPQIEQAIKEAARKSVGFELAVAAQNAAAKRYQLNPHVPADVGGNRLFLEVAKQHGVNIDLAKLSPTALESLNDEAGKACRDQAYKELRVSQGAKGEVSDAVVEAAIQERFTKILKTRYLPTLEKVNQLDLDASSKAKLIDYVSHLPADRVGRFDYIDRSLQQRSQLTELYQALPQLLHDVEQSRDNPVENQVAKTALYTKLLESGKALSNEATELVVAHQQKTGEVLGTDDINAFYSVAGDLAVLLCLDDQQAEQMQRAYAMPTTRDIFDNLIFLEDVATNASTQWMGGSPEQASMDDAAVARAEEEAHLAQFIGKAVRPCTIALDNGIKASPYTQEDMYVPVSSLQGRTASFAELDNAIINTLHETDFKLPFLDRSNQSGFGVLPESLNASLEKDMQSLLSPDDPQMAGLGKEDLVRSFLSDLGRQDYTLQQADGAAVAMPHKASAKSPNELKNARLIAMQSFCYQHQRDAWMKKHQGAVNEREVHKLASNELKIISQLANHNLWEDFIGLMVAGKMPFTGAAVGGQTSNIDYNIIADADGGFRCESNFAMQGGQLSKQAMDAYQTPAEVETVTLDPQEVSVKSRLVVAVKAEDLATGATPRLSFTQPVSYEYNLKLAEGA